MSFLEREIGKVFKAELEKNEYLLSDNVNRQQYFTRFKVYLNKRVPTNGQDFRQFWKDKSLPPNYIPPPQPEIDMILVDNRNKWHAIELKAIKRTERGMYPSYYFGLGQTLAYLSFGFDEIAIWQCYDGLTLKDAEIFSYELALTRIWQPLRPIVGSTYFKIVTNNGKTRIQTETGIWQDGIGRYDPSSGKHLFISASGNPFLNAPTANAIREFLEIQKKEKWDKS